jgi:hypothetical protein
MTTASPGFPPSPDRRITRVLAWESACCEDVPTTIIALGKRAFLAAGARPAALGMAARIYVKVEARGNGAAEEEQL